MDIIFGAAIAFCIYIVLKPMVYRPKAAAATPKPESPKTTESPQVSKESAHVSKESPQAPKEESPKAPKEEPSLAPKEEPLQVPKEEPSQAPEEASPSSKPSTPLRYSPAFIRQLNPGAPSASPNFSIVSKPPELPGRHSPRPGDSRAFFRNYSPEPFEFSMRSPRTRLSEEEERQYEQSMRELTPDYCPFAADDLPKDIQLGRVHWKRSTSGRIHVQEPINGVRDIFFHLRDCELKPGEEIQLGDQVMFELALFEGRLCAVHVKKMATKVIPSPDFSRRVMKHSEEAGPKVDSLVL